MKKNNILAIVLNLIALIEIILFPILFILFIWVEHTDILIKLLLSDFVLFISTLFFYWIWICIWTPEHNK